MFRLIVLSALVALAVAATEMQINSNPHQNKAGRAIVIVIDGRNHTFGLTKKTWYQAQEVCSTQVQRMLTLDTKAKSDFWVEYLANNPNLDMLSWIAGRREARAVDFYWTTTHEVFKPRQTNWGVGKPDSENTYAQCVNFASFSEGWNDDDCGNVSHSYICEDTPV